MDRLLSNPHPHTERKPLYRALCHTLCGRVRRPLILVDWTDVAEQHRLLLLRAALVCQGRAIPLYEAVYPLKHYNSPSTHGRFLVELQALLPASCVPIIITDAGFRGPWFAAVEKLGWGWIGRVRNCINYRWQSQLTWRQSSDLYPHATSRPQYLGPAQLSTKHPYACHLYLYKKLCRHRVARRSVAHLARHSNSIVFAEQQRDPWLIATNLPPASFSPHRIMTLYGKRMQIESCFRDLKSDRFGFGLTLRRSHHIERLNTLLLLATLATLCLWWVGLHARHHGWHRRFQTNTVASRPVLSVLFLALEVLRRDPDCLPLPDLLSAHRRLQHLIIANQHV
jgi:hypothetical protein